MKYAILAALSILLFTGCHKGGSHPTVENTYEIKQNPVWEAEKFKGDYTIQFPPGYTGHGMIGFEGNTFDKRTDDDSMHFFYAFCSPVLCNDFGDTLKNTGQETFEGAFLNGADLVQLTKRVNFTSNHSLTGIFYHNEDPFSHGKLFWKDGGVFKEALNVRYRKERLQQVMEIIGTIQRN